MPNQEGPFPIYMDNQATTPLDPRVLQAMMPYLSTDFGNPSSRHHVFGHKANDAVEKARKQVASLIGAEADEIIFTAGATESNNLALYGVMEAYREKGRHLITSAIEHKSILEPVAKLGMEATVVPVSIEGFVEPDAIKEQIRPSTVLVSVMTANNEVGTLQPISEIASICKERSIIFHTDATQGIGKVSIDVEKQNIDLLSLSAHKVYGPKGIGALYVRKRKPRVKVSALAHGGGQERGLRPGTLNTPAIVGLGEACEIAKKEMTEEQSRLGRLRDKLLAELLRVVPDLRINGSLHHRLAGNLSLEIPGVDSEALLYALKQLAISSGSACTSHTVEPSHVLLALGLTREAALNSIRISIGRFNTENDIPIAAEELAKEIKRIRALRGYQAKEDSSINQPLRLELNASAP